MHSREMRQGLAIGFHAVTFLQFAFAVYYDYTYTIVPHNVAKVHSAFGGKFKFLTFWDAVSINRRWTPREPSRSRQPKLPPFVCIYESELSPGCAQLVHPRSTNSISSLPSAMKCRCDTRRRAFEFVVRKLARNCSCTIVKQICRQILFESKSRIKFSSYNEILLHSRFYDRYIFDF